MSTLSERLKIALAGPPRIKQKDLAASCGVKPSSVSDWLSGKTKNMEGSHLLAAARFLKVNPDWLADNKGPMRTENSQTEEERNVTANDIGKSDYKVRKLDQNKKKVQIRALRILNILQNFEQMGDDDLERLEEFSDDLNKKSSASDPDSDHIDGNGKNKKR